MSGVLAPILAPKRKRGKAIKRPEQDIQIAIATYLTLIAPRHAPSAPFIWHHSPNGGGRSRAEGGLFKAMGTLAGFPDAISKTCLSPLTATISIRADVGLANIKNHLISLQELGYIDRTGTRRLTLLHVKKWPDGITPRNTEGREDGFVAEDLLADLKAYYSDIPLCTDAPRPAPPPVDKPLQKSDPVAPAAPTPKPAPRPPVYQRPISRPPEPKPAPKVESVDDYIAANGVKRYEPGIFEELVRRPLEAAGYEVVITRPKGVRTWLINGKPMDEQTVIDKANVLRASTGLAELSV